jgi:hypothetical protein
LINGYGAQDASAKIDGAKINPNDESTKEIQTVKTVDISRSAGQSQDVKRPVEIVHEILAKEDTAAKKE